MLNKLPSGFSSNLSTVEYLTDRYGVDIFKERDEYGHSPAHWMALNGHFNIARYSVNILFPCVAVIWPT